MEKLDKSSRYWQPLMDMVVSIDNIIPLKKENQVLIVLKLDTEEKVQKWFDWIASKLKGENDLKATEVEIVRAAVQIAKECDEKKMIDNS